MVDQWHMTLRVKKKQGFLILNSSFLILRRFPSLGGEACAYRARESLSEEKIGKSECTERGKSTPGNPEGWKPTRCCAGAHVYDRIEWGALKSRENLRMREGFPRSIIKYAMNRQLLLSLACIAVLVLLFTDALPMLTTSDMSTFKDIAQNVDAFTMQQTREFLNYYPPLATVYFWLIAHNPLHLSFPMAWGVGLLGCTLLTMLIAGVFLRDRWVRWLLPAILVSTVLLHPQLLFERFDLLVMLLLYLTIAAHAARKERLMGVFFISACFLKFSPLFLLPLVWVASHKKRELVQGMLSGAAGTILLFVLIGGPRALLRNIVSFVTFRGAHGIDMMSSLSAMDMLLRRLLGKRVFVGQHSDDPLTFWNFDFPHAVNMFLLVVAAGAVLWIAFDARKHLTKNPASFPLFSCATLLILLILTPLFSPHYLFWLLPLVLMWFFAEVDKKRERGKGTMVILLALIATGLLTQWIYPYHWDLLRNAQPLHAAIIHNLRTIAMMVLAVALWKKATEGRLTQKKGR